MILKNPFYIGIIQFNGKEYQGAQTPLISDKLYKDVQKKLHRKQPIKRRKHFTLLQGLVTCGHCDKGITWQLQRGKYYGSCQRKLDVCKQQKYIVEEEVQKKIVRMLDDLIDPSEMVLNWLTDLLRSDFKSSVDATEEMKKNIAHRIARLRQMDEMLYDDKLAGAITPDRYQTKHESFMSEMKELEAQKGGVDEEYADKYNKGITLIELTQSAKQQFLSKETDTDDKRSILIELFEKMIFKDGILSVNYTKLAQAIARGSAQSREILTNV